MDASPLREQTKHNSLHAIEHVRFDTTCWKDTETVFAYYSSSGQPRRDLRLVGVARRLKEEVALAALEGRSGATNVDVETI